MDNGARQGGGWPTFVSVAFFAAVWLPTLNRGARVRKILFAVAVIVMSACGGGSETPTAPTVVVPACQTNRTGTVILRNAGSRTVDMLWNNSARGAVNPGQSLPEFTVPASGPQYAFDAIITNTNTRPCLTLLATPIQCQVNTFATCTF